MAYLAFALALWSLTGAVLLRGGRARASGVWGWSWSSNLWLGVGLMLAGLALAFEERLAAGQFWGISGRIWLAAPWLVVLIALALRLRARRAAREAREDQRN